MKRRWILLALGLGCGATAGWLWQHEAGCAGGSCAITSSPVNSTIYGAVMGALLVSTLLPTRATNDKRTTHQQTEP